MLIFDFSTFDETNKHSLHIANIDYTNSQQEYPFPRWGSSMVSYNDNLILFAGKGIKDFNDLWIYYTSSNQWKQVYIYLL